jgi:hypothetical protein
VLFTLPSEGAALRIPAEHIVHGDPRRPDHVERLCDRRSVHGVNRAKIACCLPPQSWSPWLIAIILLAYPERNR